MANIGDKIELTEELWLAMKAGARAIEKTEAYEVTAYVWRPWLDNKEIPYMRAAEVLREATKER